MCVRAYLCVCQQVRAHAHLRVYVGRWVSTRACVIEKVGVKSVSSRTYFVSLKRYLKHI